MPKPFLLILLLSHLLVAQTRNVSELSMYRFIDSEIVYEDNEENVFGYFLLYEKDQIDKSIYEMEYVLLDRNLNTLHSATFKQVRNNLFDGFGARIQYCKKVGQSLYFNIDGTYTKTDWVFSDIGISSVQKLDLENFTLSEPSQIKGYEESQRSYMEFCFLTPTKSSGFIVFDEPATVAVKRTMFKELRSLKNMNRFSFLDLNLKPKWNFLYNTDSTDVSFKVYRYSTGKGADLVFKKYHFETGADEYPELSYEFFNAHNGKIKFELSLHKDQYLLDIKEIKFEPNTIVVYAALNDYNKEHQFKHGSITGYAKLVLDRKDGKELSADYFLWEDIASQYAVDRNGKIKDYGSIFFHDFSLLSDGKTIAIGESYESGMKTYIKDLFLFVFDKNMHAVEVRKLEKFTNSVYFKNVNGKQLSFAGAFDYLFKQRMAADDEFVFFYRDNEKELNKSANHSKWQLGIVTYSAGNFAFDKIALNRGDKRIYPIKAKNGYILLRESSSTGSELRLEKIQY